MEALISDQRNMQSSFNGTEFDRNLDELQKLHYSAEFTADINTKMRIPDKLSMSAEQNLGIDIQQPPANMQVPERILVAGSGQHIGVRESPVKLNLDELVPLSSASGDVPIGLETPPRVLTLEDHPFPTLDEEAEQEAAKVDRRSLERLAAGNSQKNLTRRSLHDSPVPPNVLEAEASGSNRLLAVKEEGLVVEEGSIASMPIDQQVYLLACEVNTLKEENAERNRRELIFYGLTLTYVTFKLFRHLMQTW